MGNAPSSSSRSSTAAAAAAAGGPSASSTGGGPSASSPLPTTTTTSGGNGPSPSTFVGSLTSRARARTRSASSAAAAAAGAGPLTASQILATEPLIDGGHTLPLNLYQLAAWDFQRDVVRRLVLDRRLAPFYLGLEDWAADAASEAELVRGLREARAVVERKRQVLREAGEPTGEVDGLERLLHGQPQASGRSSASKAAAAAGPAKQGKEGPPTEVERREAEWYADATAECPLCFLYYPPNINTSRCCDQPICTECFVQIKRAEATATHLESEPACCPFCMEPNFGILYSRPKPKLTAPNHGGSSSALASALSSATAGGGATGHHPHHHQQQHAHHVGAFVDDSSEAAAAAGGGGANGSGFELGPPPAPAPAGEAEAADERRAEKKRRQSVSHTEKEVVTVDQIRPDWEAKLEAVKATVARRANRRIVMRQVGDRLIPIGITSSREPIAPINLGSALAGGGAGGGEADGGGGGGEAGGGAQGGRSAGRRRSRGGAPGGGGTAEVERLLSGMGLGGADIEELMLMEAMRLSLLEHEQQQAREAAAAAEPSTTTAPPTTTTTTTGSAPAPPSAS